MIFLDLSIDWHTCVVCSKCHVIEVLSLEAHISFVGLVTNLEGIYVLLKRSISLCEYIVREGYLLDPREGAHNW